MTKWAYSFTVYSTYKYFYCFLNLLNLSVAGFGAFGVRKNLLTKSRDLLR